MNTHKREQHLLHLINNAFNVCSVVMLANAKSSGKVNNCHERHRKKLRERSSQQIENLQSSKMLASTKHTNTIQIDEKEGKKTTQDNKHHSLYSQIYEGILIQNQKS